MDPHPKPWRLVGKTIFDANDQHVWSGGDFAMLTDIVSAVNDADAARERIARLTEALKPFLYDEDALERIEDDYVMFAVGNQFKITIGDLRRAREALKGETT